MKRMILSLIFLLGMLNAGFAQEDVYYTRNATLRINGAFDGEAIFAETKEVSVKLDYETTEMILRFPLYSLTATKDTLNRFLKNKLFDIIFIGELGLDYINTESHPPQAFAVEGWLIIETSKIKIVGKGELHHVNDSGEYACMLGLNMPLNLKDLKINLPWPGLADDIEVVVTQALLRKDKN
jgi:hypothetical protein